jgi:hypothetical protein
MLLARIMKNRLRGQKVRAEFPKDFIAQAVPERHGAPAIALLRSASREVRLIDMDCHASSKCVRLLGPRLRGDDAWWRGAALSVAS